MGALGLHQLFRLNHSHCHQPYYYLSKIRCYIRFPMYQEAMMCRWLPLVLAGLALVASHSLQVSVPR
jgi:hypothetical protein